MPNSCCQQLCQQLCQHVMTFHLPSCRVVDPLGLCSKTKVFLKFFHVDELDHMLIECHRKATILQKTTRGFKARRAHRALLEKAKQQEAEAKHFLSRGSELVERYVVMMRTMTEFDLKIRHGKRQSKAMARK